MSPHILPGNVVSLISQRDQRLYAVPGLDSIVEVADDATLLVLAKVIEGVHTYVYVMVMSGLLSGQPLGRMRIERARKLW